MEVWHLPCGGVALECDMNFRPRAVLPDEVYDDIELCMYISMHLLVVMCIWK